MRKMIGRILLLILIFCGSVTVTAFFLNSESTDNRQEMNDPTLPEVMVDFGGILANRMYGYFEPMQTDYIRDCVTPLDTTRSLTFVVNPYQTGVYSLAYEIRTSDGSRVIENRKVKSFSTDDNKNIRTTVEISSDLRLNQEYSMQITLETSQGTVYYYSRVISRSNLNTEGYLRFVRTFVEKSLDKQNVNDLMDYMEPDLSTTVTNYAHIDIHATQSQLGWGTLGVQMYRRGIPMIRDINETTASITMDYQLSSMDENNMLEIYDISEFFRMRYTSSRIMLLDYSRNADQVFYPRESNISESGLLLGIRDRNVDYMTNSVAGITAFVQEGDIWSFSVKDAKTTRIFSFRRDESGDYRDARKDHDIQIVRVYDNADVDFVVYGYMNRGLREGFCGVCVYHYDNDRNVIEERAFIPVTESFDFLSGDLGKCSYVSTDGCLYLLFAGSLYRINIPEGSYTVLEEGINEEDFASSRTGAHGAWVIQEGEEAGSIREMDFETGRTRLISPKEERQLRLIGFMNEDLIYGIVREKDILTDESGHVYEGMRALVFENFDGEELKRYTPDKKQFITDPSLGTMLLEFSIATKKGTGYSEIKKDNILNNSPSVSREAHVEMTNSARYGLRVRLAFPSALSISSPLAVFARQRGTGSRMVRLPAVNQEKTAYYVYAMGHLQGVYSDPSVAVRKADEQVGVVLNSEQQYVWERGNKKANAMLNLDDIPEAMKVKNPDLQTLGDQLKEDGSLLDLTGCSLDQVLYEVSANRPILARTGEGQSVLIVGYDEYNTWLLNSDTGEVYACGMQDSTDMFEKGGNVFMTYMEKVQL